MRRHFSLLMILGLFIMPAHGQGLIGIYELAAQNDPQLKVVRAQMESVRESKPQAMARLRPTVSASTGADRIKRDVRSSSTGARDSSYSSSDFVLSLSQPIYRRDYWIQLEQSDRQIAQAEAEYASAEQELMIRVSQAYFDVLSAEDTLEFAQAELTAIGRQLDQAKQRFEVGLIAITAVHEAQAAFDQSRADEIRADNEVGNAWEALHEIIGHTEAALTPLSSDLPLNPPDPMDINQWSDTALEQNLSLIALRNATEFAKQKIDLEYAGHYPTIELVGSHSLNSSSASSSTDSETSSIGFQLNMPLYSGGSVTSSTRQARFDYEAAQENLDKQRRAVNRQARDAYRGVVSSISGVKALEASTISAKSALEATEAGFEVGTRTMVDVLDEQRDLYRVRRDYSSVRYGYIMSGLRLKFAAGVISRTDLEAVNGWLE
ncbi:TolC family outer membrane protein [Pseudomonadota bacterium]